MSSLQPVRGTHDLLGRELQQHLWIVSQARRVATLYGCQEISTPVFEFSQVFLKNLGEGSDIITKETYQLKDRNKESLTLRPEGTAPLVRAFLSNKFQNPVKLFYQGPMFRYERPQRGRQRQFHQFGVEFLAWESVASDGELLSLAHNSLQNLQLNSPIQLEINNLGTAPSRKSFKEALKKYLEQKKNQLSSDSQKRLQVNPLRILDSKSVEDQKILKSAPRLEEFLKPQETERHKKLKERLQSLEIPFTENPLLVRGLDYYDHCVFEFKAQKNLGEQNTVLAGGRYNHLIENMGGPSLSSTGFAAGIERLSLLTSTPEKPIPLIAFLPFTDGAEEPIAKLAISFVPRVFMWKLFLREIPAKNSKKPTNEGPAGPLSLGKGTEPTKGLCEGVRDRKANFHGYGEVGGVFSKSTKKIGP